MLSIKLAIWTKVGGNKGGAQMIAKPIPLVLGLATKGLQHAMTSSEERTSAESRGLPHRDI